MSRSIKYLGSNCKPVIAETVESDTQTQTQSSPKENTMTLLNAADKTPATKADVATALTALKDNVETILAENNQVIEGAEMKAENIEVAVVKTNDVKAEEASPLKAVAEAKAKASGFSWTNVAAAGALAGINVAAHLLIERKLTEEEEERSSALSIAARVAVNVVAASAVQSIAQTVVKDLNDSGLGSLISVSASGHGVAIVDTLAGDSIAAMFGSAVSKGKSAYDSYMTKEEVEVVAE